ALPGMLAAALSGMLAATLTSGAPGLFLLQKQLGAWLDVKTASLEHSVVNQEATGNTCNCTGSHTFQPSVPPTFGILRIRQDDIGIQDSDRSTNEGSNRSSYKGQSGQRQSADL